MLILGVLKQQMKILNGSTREYSLEDTEFRVVQGDVGRLAQKVGQETVDCIVTEPDLGPALRQVPTGPYALKIIQKLEPLYFTFVEEAHKSAEKGWTIGSCDALHHNAFGTIGGYAYRRET